MFFDSHAHIDGEKFDRDRDLVLSRAKENGIDYIMNPGADFESSVRAVKLAQEYEMVYAAVGIHPHDAASLDDSLLMMIEALTKKPKVQAIGEIGLDFHYDFSPRDTQRHWFVEQLRLARRLKLPVIVHDREANQETFDTLRKEQAFETGVLMHCYSGSAELAKQYVKLGGYISIAGPVTFKNSRKLIEVVEAVPLERLMIETDSPYLTPEPFRGKRNESLYVKYICEKIAQIKGIDISEAAEATTKNAKEYFKIK
jgi:TatD DNase family protein